MYICILFLLQVVHNVGLCIALWDIQKLEDSYIFPGDGAHHTVGKMIEIKTKNNAVNDQWIIF